jgi:hydroxymethylglutaryl-CoA lyase
VNGKPPAASERQSIQLCECTARDGLQHESGIVATKDKIALIDRFSAMGFKRIEVSSFAHPGYVPQFTDVEDVFRGIQRKPDVVYKATCVNQRAAQRAFAARAAGHGPDEISFPISASETHNLVNTRKTIVQSKEVLRLIAEEMPKGMTLTATVATAYACPFTGPVEPAAVEAMVDYYVSLGIRQVIIGDTSGCAYPYQVESLFQRLLLRFGGVTFIAHFHDNRGAGLADVLAAARLGVTHFDTSFGGLGGHPASIKYAQGLTGNVATEDVVAMLAASGFETGLDLDQLIPTAEFVESVIGRQLHGKVTRAGLPWTTLPIPALSGA